MKHLILSILFLGLLHTSACQSDENSAKVILGEWHGVNWTAAGQPVMPDASVITMVFSKEGVYNLVADTRIENGNWKIANDSLFLVPETTEDVKMRIMSLTPDNLILEMNRGRIEVLELKR